jgi:hypothetical protein
MGKNTLRNPPQPRNQLPTTQSLSRYPTCVTILVTCRRCLPSLAPPYPLKLPPNRHIMAYGKKHAAKPPTTTEPTPHNTKSLHISNVRHHHRHMPSLPPLPRTPLSPKITPKPSHYGLWQKTRCETPPQPRNQLPTTQSLSIYPTCVTIPVTCRRCPPPSHPLIP